MSKWTSKHLLINILQYFTTRSTAAGIHGILKIVCFQKPEPAFVLNRGWLPITRIARMENNSRAIHCICGHSRFGTKQYVSKSPNPAVLLEAGARYRSDTQCLTCVSLLFRIPKSAFAIPHSAKQYLPERPNPPANGGGGGNDGILRYLCVVTHWFSLPVPFFRSS